MFLDPSKRKISRPDFRKLEQTVRIRGPGEFNVPD